MMRTIKTKFQVFLKSYRRKGGGSGSHNRLDRLDASFHREMNGHGSVAVRPTHWNRLHRTSSICHKLQTDGFMVNK